MWIIKLECFIGLHVNCGPSVTFVNLRWNVGVTANQSVVNVDEIADVLDSLDVECGTELRMMALTRQQISNFRHVATQTDASEASVASQAPSLLEATVLALAEKVSSEQSRLSQEFLPTEH